MSDPLTRMRINLSAEGVDPQLSRSLLFWARSFLTWCDEGDPERLGRSNVEAFLDHLIRERFAGKPARERALEAIMRLYQAAPGGEPEWLKRLLEERRSGTTANVLTRDEVRRLLLKLGDRDWLAAALIYGTGIRLIECVRLRVRDINMRDNRLLVRDTTDLVRRRLPLPDNTQERLQEHLEDLKLLHIREIVEGSGRATLPPPIAARQPNVARNWGWQYLFPEPIESGRARGDGHGRALIHHVDPQTLHGRFERAAVDARIYRRVTGHVLRNTFALHMVQEGVSVREVEQMLGTSETETDEPFKARSLRIPGSAVPERMELNRR